MTARRIKDTGTDHRRVRKRPPTDRKAGAALCDNQLRGELEALLTVADVAALLRLTEKGVYSLIESRRIPFVRVSNRVRFLPRDVRSWLQENRVPASETSR